MEPSLRIKPNGNQWDLTGNTVVKDMDDTEMLFRIVTMTSEECSEMADNLTDQEIHNIVLKIREHRLERQKVENLKEDPLDTSVDVTKYVVQKHITKQGWN